MATENCIDVQDFRFKSAAKTKVFTGAWSEFSSHLSLLASASRFGLVFVGTPDELKVYEIKRLIEAGETSSAVPCRHVQIDGSIRMLQINCDDTLLAAVVASPGAQPRAFIYQVSTFLNQAAVSPSGHVVLASGGGHTVTDFAWNPVNPNAFCVCLSDGQISSFEVKGPSAISLINTVAAAAACVAWSPKGKQIVAATKDGRLSQYKPDLALVKTVGPPDGLGQSPEPVAIVWLSNYQFGIIFKLGGADDQRLSLCLVNTPKDGPVTAQDFDDVCYSSGDLRQNQFYLNNVTGWGVLLVASANGAEVGLLGQKEASVWQQWTLEDSARAELPMDSHADTFPLGMTFCTSATQQLVWEEAQLPHMPILLLLSHCGMLCAFYALNLKPGAQEICKPIEMQPQAGLFTAPQIVATSTEEPKAKQSTPFGQPFSTPAAEPAAAAPVPKAFSMPPPSAPAPANIFGGIQPVVSQPAKSEAAPSIFSMARPAVTIAPKVDPQPQPQPTSEVKVIKEPVAEPVMSEESFIAASTAIMRQFSEEISTSLKQSADTSFTIASCEDSNTIASSLNSAEEKSVEMQKATNDFKQQLNELQILNLEVIRQYEEVRTRLAQRENPGYIQAARMRPLDPTTQGKKKDIATRMQYIESQTGQAATLVNQAFGTQPFRPSSNMALHRTLILQRRCISNLNARLDIMESKCGHKLPSTMDLSSLTEALPKTPKSALPVLSRNDELRMSEFLKDRPISVVKRRIPAPAPSPIKPVSPLRPISPIKFASPVAKAQPAAAAKLQASPPALLSLPAGITITPVKAFVPTSQPEVPKPAVSVAAVPFSFTSKPFSFSGESKPTDFSFGGVKDAASVNIFGGTKQKEETKRVPSKLEVDVVKNVPAAEEEPKIIEIKAKEKESSPLLASILQSKTPLQPETPKSTTFSQPLLATPTTGQSVSIFLTPTTASKPSLFSGTSIFSLPASTGSAASTSSQPKFSFGPGSMSTSTPSTFAFGTSTKSSIFGTPVTAESTTDSKPSATSTSETAPTAAVVSTPNLFGLATTTTPSTAAAVSSFSFGATISLPPTSKESILTTPETAAPAESVAPKTTPEESSKTETAPVASPPPAAAFGGAAPPLLSTPVSTPTPTATVAASPFSAASLFGSTPASTAAVSTPFGSTPTTSVTTIFASPPATTATLTFGSTPPATTATLTFGSTPAPTTASAFGSTPATASTTPAFGSTPSFGTAAPGSTFGTTPVFGSAASAGSTTFGTPSATPASTFSFAQATPAASTDQVTNLFGGMGSTPGGSLFGSSSFAASPKPAASIFGGSAPQTSEQNLFGGMQACSPTNAKNLFGQAQPQANPFSSPKPAAQSTPNIFGQSPSSGAANNTSTSTFGQSGGSLFGQAFSPSKSVFGAAPSFGSNASFGAPPAFGSMASPQQQPSFGGDNRIFGSGSNAAPSFGQQASSPPSGLFGAAADALSFGNLAQQPSPFGQQQQPPPPQNNNQGASFGGNSFSSWR
ncbi:nuclear pore complex protein Nup214 [Neocloeon triangulifer]|uniref:nuclear pore complex protein Nup214 n=1 Tax=Neocloeon triangulifer TaxID=2078957 RepID=UPI00286ED78D|nr:nuclear pore complex protein Nup214 [Neocloeon triangulifer]